MKAVLERLRKQGVDVSGKLVEKPGIGFPESQSISKRKKSGNSIEASNLHAHSIVQQKSGASCSQTDSD